MTGKINENMLQEPCVISGDSQCGSPGYTAKYMCYSIQESAANCIFHMQFLDKRMTQNVSTRMEIVGCEKALEKLSHSLDINEFASDACRTVIKNMKDKFPNIHHSLDVFGTRPKILVKLY